MSGTPALLEICQPQEADVIVVRDYRHSKWTTSNQIVYEMSIQLEKYKRRCVDLRETFEQEMKEQEARFREQEARFREQEARFRKNLEELEADLEESYLDNLKKEDIVYKNEFIDQKQKNALNVMLFHEVTCPHCNKKVFH
ncbi:hypothetical protein ABK040_003728 [Willaertia magna]